MKKSSSASAAAPGSKRRKARRAAGAVAAIAAAFGGAAAAQSNGFDAGAPVPEGFRIGGAAPAASAPSRILVISIQRLSRESLAGRSIDRQAQLLREEVLAEVEARQQALRDEEQRLAASRDDLPRAEFEAQVQNFKDEWRKVRRAEQEAVARLQNALQEATKRFREARNAVLTDLMAQHEGAVMLDEASVVLSASALNVTDEAIRRLDVAAPSIAVELPAPDASLEPAD